MAISEVQPRWIESVIDGYAQDPKAQQLLTELAVSNSNDHGFSLHKGVIRDKGCVWLGTHERAQQAVMLAFHNIALGGAFRHSSDLSQGEKVVQLARNEGRSDKVCPGLYCLPASEKRAC